MARLVLAAAFFVILEQFRPGESPIGLLDAAVVCFLVAVATDYLDGFLARRWGATSAFGRVMDPLCDKILIIGAFIYLASPRFADPAGGTLSGVEPWMVVVILLREFLVTSLRALAESQGQSFGASFSGKAKMIVQSAAVPVLLILIGRGDLSDGGWAVIVRDVTVWTTVAVTVVSGVPYLRRAASSFSPTRPSTDA